MAPGRSIRSQNDKTLVSALADSLKLQPGAAVQPWVRAQYTDSEGNVWKELDIAALVQNEAFLEVSL